MKKIYLFVIFIAFNPLFANQKKQDTTVYKTKPLMVTALKYEEDQIETPIASSIIMSGIFQNNRSIGAESVLNQAPGVFAQSRSGGSDIRLTIRGFGARGAGDRSNSGTSRGVKILIDGIPETEPDGRTAFDNIDINSFSKVEVIRSNASALWGNASGGVVNFTAEPLYYSPYLDITSKAGSYGFNSYILKVGSPLKTGNIFATYNYSKFDGWRAHSGSERSSINTTIKSALGTDGILSIYILGSMNKFNIPGPLTIEQFESNPEQANKKYLSQKERRDNKNMRLALGFDQNFGESGALSASVYLNPKYLQRSERNTYRDFTRYHLGGSINYKYELPKFFDEKIKLVNLIGLDNSYQDGAILFYNLTADGNRGATLSSNKSEGANSFGAFYQAEFKYDEKISAIIGARFDQISYYSQDFMKLNAKQSKSYSHLSPKLGVSYRLNEYNAVYVSLGSGVEAPAGNETDPTPSDTVNLINQLLEPIISQNIDLGFKGIIEIKNCDLIKGFNYDAALFFIKVKNELMPSNDSKKNVRGKYYLSASETFRQGFELGANIDFNYGVSLSFAGAYINSYYQDYKDSSILTGKLIDYKDNEIAGIPKFYYVSSLKYNPNFLSDLVLDLSIQGVSDYFVDDANTFTAPSYTILNLSISALKLIEICSTISIRPFISANNLLDKKYVGSVFINPDKDENGSALFIEPGLPRNINFGLSISFN